jgi:hypothetical protein
VTDTLEKALKSDSGANTGGNSLPRYVGGRWPTERRACGGAAQRFAAEVGKTRKTVAI